MQYFGVATTAFDFVAVVETLVEICLMMFWYVWVVSTLRHGLLGCGARGARCQVRRALLRNKKIPPQPLPGTKPSKQPRKTCVHGEMIDIPQRAQQHAVALLVLWER